MDKFIKGYTYLVKVIKKYGRQFWLVKQIGQRSWVAMEITTCSAYYTRINVKEGNGMVLMEELKKLSDNNILDIRQYKFTKNMREEMFNVLKYGRFIDE